MPHKIGKFEILKTLGSGSMGEVLLARDEVLGRNVAIKTVRPGSSFGAEAQARFEREARATAAMNHPGIVTVFDFGEQDGLHYLVMEFIEGEDLELLIASKSMGKADLLEALAQACEGLAYAHERGVIHRDVKPSNILVSRRGKRLQAKLTDFGVALVDRSTLTDKGTWMGTVSYMAPEYLDTGKATPSSDLFAVGVMLYEVLTGGRKPFIGETTTGILNAILRNPAPSLSPDETQGISPAILEVTRRALSKDPADRYPSAEALAAAIREAIQMPTRPPQPRADLVVGKGGKTSCLSLRVALRQAAPGATVHVLPGHYRESLVIDKDITICGEGDPSDIHLESPKGPCLTFESCKAVIRGLTLHQGAEESAPLIEVRAGRVHLESCELSASSATALEVKAGGAHLVMKAVRVFGGTKGIKVGQGSTVMVEEVVLEGQMQAALWAEPGATATLHRTMLKKGSGVGLHLQPTAQASLEDCTVEDFAAGAIEVGPGAHIRLLRCRVLRSAFAGLLALEKSHAELDDCELSDHEGAGIHAQGGANIHAHDCRLVENGGFGLSILGSSLAALEGCKIARNGGAGILIHQGATAQLKDCRVTEGKGLGLICSASGRGVLESCEISGNAQSGAKVEPGGSLLLLRCVVKDGHDTGILLFQDAEATLEECVIHRNARGGILLTKDAADPILRGQNKIDDELVRLTPQGPIKLTTVKKR